MKNPNTLFIQNFEVETQRIVKFIRKHFVSCPRKKVVFGLSGGLDSAVCASLYCRALGPENVHVVLMPAPNSSGASEKDAKAQAGALKIPEENIHYRPLGKILAAYGFADTELKNASLRIGNVSARLRMINLFDLADEVGAIVSGTENLTENLLGYFTIGGDEVSLIEPIHHLYKWEVRKLAEYLGVIPEILNKRPSAELWDGQTDEGELGFSYNDADITLVCKMAESAKNPSDYGVDEVVAEKVLARVNYTEFKRKKPVHLERA